MSFLNDDRKNQLNGLGNGLGKFAANLKTKADSAMQTVKDVANQAGESYGRAKAELEATKQAQIEAEEKLNNMFAEPEQVQFCIKCGAKNEIGARFCKGCGATISQAGEVVAEQANSNNRTQEYAGIVSKCPNCGEPISNTDVVCPACGYQITGRAASSSVQRLQNQLMAIENTRRQRSAFESLFYDEETDAEIINNKKVTLIKSFPIPNTIDEIAEFVILASTNIDVRLSKKSWFGKSGDSDEKALSDAWVGKLEQAYQKAELMFSDKPVFDKVRNIYEEKMAELNMLKR